MIESLAAQWLRALLALSVAEAARLCAILNSIDELGFEAAAKAVEATAADASSIETAYAAVDAVLTAARHPRPALTALTAVPTDATTAERAANANANTNAIIADAAAERAYAAAYAVTMETVATLAASVIVGRNVPVRALEAEPTPAQLADWLGRVAKALTLALARVEMVRAPTRIITAMLDTRAGLSERAERVRVPGVFAFAELDQWRFRPPKNHPLTLPFEGSSKGMVRASEVLTGPLLRAYIATWQLVEESDLDAGCFTMDVRHVIRDLYGVPMYREPGRGILRTQPAADRTFKLAFNTLQRIQIEGVGEMKLGDSKLGRQPQWLITCMEFPKAKVYQHAPVAMLALRNFIQVPRAVLRLEADDTALALGVASLWYRRIGDALREAGHYRATLQQLATGAGEDVAQKTRDRGARAYYRTLAERLARVVTDGQLGELHLEGEGPTATATLTPSPALATVYQSFAVDRPAPTLDAGEVRSKAAELATRPRRPGRPRKGV